MEQVIVVSQLITALMALLTFIMALFINLKVSIVAKTTNGSLELIINEIKRVYEKELESVRRLDQTPTRS